LKKVKLSIAVELLLIISALFYLSTQSENEFAFSVTEKNVRTLTRTYFDSLNLLMLTGFMDETQSSSDSMNSVRNAVSDVHAQQRESIHNLTSYNLRRMF